MAPSPCRSKRANEPPAPSPADLLYPPKCPFCGRVVDRGDPIPCPKCRDTLPWVEPGDVCAPPEGCNACLSPLWYRDLAREAVRRYKFGGGQNHAAVLGTLMAQCLRERWDGPADSITWAPLSARRLRERGYDQAELLARRVGELSGLPAVPTLEKIRHTVAQSRIEDDSARLANVQRAYRLLPGVDLPGQTVVLVDDVVTTGATLSQCAALLRQAGAARVVALTLARSRK